MAIHVVKVPDIGEGIAEVELVLWHAKPGDAVVADQVLADVMTDKATVEVPSPVDGTVLATTGKAGDRLAVGSELLRIETGDALAPAATASGSRAGEKEPSPPPSATASPSRAGERQPSPLPAATAPSSGGREREPSPQQAVTPPSSGGGESERAGREIAARAAPGAPPLPAERGEGRGEGTLDAQRSTLDRDFPAEPGSDATRPLASPSVRRQARALGVDLARVRGTGPDGRVLHEDVLRRAGGDAARPASTARYAARTGEEEVPVIGLRRQIALRMQDALRIPHFTYVEEVDVTELEALRSELNARHAASRGRLTLLPFLMRAIALAVPDFPQVNAHLDDKKGLVTRFAAAHIGVATQTASGLMVPVVRHAEARDLWSAAAEVARLAQAARAGKATRNELTGSTITITSLGPLGGIVTTPVINPPEVAIVGVNRIVERPAIRAGAVVPRKLMNLSSSFDHRVIDGQVGAEFVQALRGYLECPALLFVE